MECWVRDPITKKKSVTLTMFVWGMLVCVFKLLISGHTAYGIVFETFSGSDFAMAVGALGSIYGFRRSKWAADNGNGDGLPSKNEITAGEKPPVEGVGP